MASGATEASSGAAEPDTTQAASGATQAASGATQAASGPGAASGAPVAVGGAESGAEAGRGAAPASAQSESGRGVPSARAEAGGGAAGPDAADTGDVLAAAVSRVRRAAGLTLSAVAARAGVSPAYVSQMESGAANPTVRTLCQIADALGATPAELLGGTPPGAVTAAAAFPPRFAPAPLLATAEGHHGIWDLTASGASRLGARLLHADLGDHVHPTTHAGEEFVLVLGGSCRVSVAGTVRLLRPADSCHFAATDEHHFTDPSDDLLMLVVLTEE